MKKFTLPPVKVLKIDKKDVKASPTKAFFVEMLTRDIELKDAVLDLLDNCLDGVLRSLGETPKKSNKINQKPPYETFYAEIEFDKDFFRISDNCGGMSRKVLEERAFRLGRPKSGSEKDRNLATVGLYGIGMKRAIFKMGMSCVVTTRHKNEAYQVVITPEWLSNDELWDLDLKTISPEKLKEGTSIEIRNLHTSVSNEFDRKKNKEFEEDFSAMVATHYSYIFHKGFSVKINGKSPKPRDFNFRFNTLSSDEKKIAPFMYKGKIEGVDVELLVGLYRDVPSQNELEEMDEGVGFRKENAGWTVICNDRVVLYSDTSHVTGWGEGNVPKYHTQFVAISGIVRFSSDNPGLLPLTTTKRGINQNSVLYAEVKNIMRQGLKHFTNFTNHWKVDPAQRKQIYKETTSVDPWKALKLVPAKDWTDSRKFGGQMFVPKLPVPAKTTKNNRTISFSRPVSEIELLGEYLFEDRTVAPSRVGEHCFEKYVEFAVSEGLR